MNWFRLKCCVKCGGDLVLDQGDWLCLQCGTYYYSGLYRRPDLKNGPRPDSQPHKEKSWITGGSPLHCVQDAGFNREGVGYQKLVSLGPLSIRLTVL